MPETATKITVETLSGTESRAFRPALIDLLADAVAADAAVGFLDPLSMDQAVGYWERVFVEVEANRRLILVVRDAERIIGAVQLGFPACTNADHRAEAKNLIVHTSARHHGLGTALMLAAEEASLARGRRLLTIHTRAGDPACKLLEKVGYSRAGVIPGHARSPSGRLHGTAIYYRDLSNSDALMLGENGSFAREDR